MNGADFNRMSYFDAGREEPVKGGLDEVEQPNEGGWDVYADFNNAGSRYRRIVMHLASLIKNQGASPLITLPCSAHPLHDGYQQLSPQLSRKVDEEANAQGPVEMVTIPALGAQWGKDELKDMTKRGRREKDKEDFGRKWNMFNRGQYGLFGRKWLTRRTLVFSLFGLCAAYVVLFAAHRP